MDMPRGAHNAPGSLAHRVINRTVARHALFQKDGDYEAFEGVFADTPEKHPTRVLFEVAGVGMFLDKKPKKVAKLGSLAAAALWQNR